MGKEALKTKEEMEAIARKHEIAKAKKVPQEEQKRTREGERKRKEVSRASLGHEQNTKGRGPYRCTQRQNGGTSIKSTESVI